ncbi:MAG TPA: phosphocholine cytidylyltransferase family protein [Magnetospirillaceae bacterium]|nr:phosphocholine cytidylyltransferase family protein [Magnetospirillaceae bacterium]
MRPETISVILLVAGVGRRLNGAAEGPKVLLEFGERTLLDRHLEALHANGLDDVHLTVGFEADQIRAELARLGRNDVTLTENPDYTLGSLVSFHVQNRLLRSGKTIILMDGDVLYPAEMIRRLLDSPQENVLLLDRNLEPGDEPVKICLKDGKIVDFRKKPVFDHDWHGESVGFFRFSPAMAAELADICETYVAEGRTREEYEEAIRDKILTEPDRFAATDVSDIPWTEIDFIEDVERARNQILPRLEA